MQRVARWLRRGSSSGAMLAAGGWIEQVSGDGVQLMHDGAPIEQITVTLLACWNPAWEVREIREARLRFDGPIVAPPRVLLANGEGIDLDVKGRNELRLHADALRHSTGICAEVRHAGVTHGHRISRAE